MRHALVTGAAGFIGSHLCEQLLAQGWVVTGVDSLDTFYNPEVKKRNLRYCILHPRFSFKLADIRNKEIMEQLMSDHVDVVIHLAARAGVRPSIDEPLLYTDVNILGTQILLEATKKNSIKKFIFASSSSVYGNAKKVPFEEKDMVDFPISPYAATKKTGELIAHTYHHLYGIHITCLRFFTVYGPRQRPDLAIHKFTHKIAHGEQIDMFGDGGMKRDYTYIDDIISGIISSIEQCEGFNIYNLGNSSPIGLREMIQTIEDSLGKKAIIQQMPQQPGDVEITFADVRKAMAELHYQPRTSFKQGIDKFVSWYLQENGILRNL